MCGIIGIIGSTSHLGKELLDGIKKLEYRGYDSAGIATIDKGKAFVKKEIGKINQVDSKVALSDLKGVVGISHTRWATHGKVTKNNAHPHHCCNQKIAIAHNGIIENHLTLKKKLIKKGHRFSSDTDTEVVVHLIEEYYQGDIAQATRKALQDIEGTYALGVICADQPDVLIAARNESPLVVGLGKNKNFIASDVPAILKHTNKVIYLEDREIAVLTKNNYTILTGDGEEQKKKIHTIEWSAEDAEKSGFDHFMLKEIHEQPVAITETISGRLQNGHVDIEQEIQLTKEDLKHIKRIIIIACGTSWHAGLTGEFMLEELAKIPVEVEYASEFRYRNPLLDNNTLVIAISQSGETADTNTALKKAKELGAKTLAICNVKGSSMTRIADGTLHTKAGPEIGVASTKAFTTQLIVLYLLTIVFAKARAALNEKQIQSMISGLRKIPLQIQQVLEEDKDIVELAQLYHHKTNSLYLGRGVNFPIALEGALKLKEVSYIHAEGYPAAEMKHGPIALIDKDMPVVVIAPHDVYTYEKIQGNIEEVKARGGVVIAIATEGDKEIPQKADHTIFIPKSLYTLSSILAVIPLQLLAYHIALKRKCDVDQPRNLSKVVTVE